MSVLAKIPIAFDFRISAEPESGDYQVRIFRQDDLVARSYVLPPCRRKVASAHGGIFPRIKSFPPARLLVDILKYR